MSRSLTTTCFARGLALCSVFVAAKHRFLSRRAGDVDMRVRLLRGASHGFTNSLKFEFCDSNPVCRDRWHFGIRRILAGSSHSTGRNKFVILRTDCSPPVALHLLFQERSYFQLIGSDQPMKRLSRFGSNKLTNSQTH